MLAMICTMRLLDIYLHSDDGNELHFRWVDIAALRLLKLKVTRVLLHNTASLLYSIIRVTLSLYRLETDAFCGLLNSRIPVLPFYVTICLVFVWHPRFPPCALQSYPSLQSCIFRRPGKSCMTVASRCEPMPGHFYAVAPLAAGQATSHLLDAVADVQAAVVFIASMHTWRTWSRQLFLFAVCGHATSRCS